LAKENGWAKIGSNLSFYGEHFFGNQSVQVFDLTSKIGYATLIAGVAGDFTQSILIDPKTGTSYQPWSTTLLNTTVNVGAAIIGGPVGIYIGAEYQLSNAQAKVEQRTPGMLDDMINHPYDFGPSFPY